MNYFLEPILIRICFLLYMLMNIILLTVLEGDMRGGQGVRGDVFVFREESEARWD